LEFKYLFGNEDHPTDNIKYNFWKADYSKINSELSTIDWQVELHEQNVVDAWFIFREKVNVLCEQYVPVKN